MANCLQEPSQKQTKVLGGVLADTEISFTGWTFWANDSEHRIKTFTELWQIGIDDSMLSATDFCANIQLIAEMMPSYSRLVFYCRNRWNFTKSLYVQMDTDKAFFPDSPNLSGREGTVTIEKNINTSLGVPVKYRFNWGDTCTIGRYDANGGNKVWYPFRTVAMANDYPIKSYSSTLEHFGLSDEEMSPDNFAENFYKLSNVMAYNYGFFAFLYCNNTICPNFLESLIKRLKDDGIDYNLTTIKPEITMLISRCGGVRAQTKIEIMIDAVAATHGNETLRDITIIGYANRDGDSMRLYPFKEVATTKQITVEPLNGWENYNGAAIVTKSGRYVNVDFDIRKGLTDRGTILFTLPEGFRPPKDIAMMVIGEGGGATMRTVVNARGEIKLYDATTETVSIIGKGGFPI